MKQQDVITALAALAQDSRLAIYRLLVKRGPEGYAAGEISERLEIAGPSLSFHLKELARAGLVTARKDGRFIYYSARLRAHERPGGLPDRELLQPGRRVRPGLRAGQHDRTQEEIRVTRPGSDLQRAVPVHRQLVPIDPGRGHVQSSGAARLAGHERGQQAHRQGPSAVAGIARPRGHFDRRLPQQVLGRPARGARHRHHGLRQRGGETCPVYLGPVLRTHWGVDDPAHATGTDAEIDAAFMRAYRTLRARIEAFLALPLDAADDWIERG